MGNLTAYLEKYALAAMEKQLKLPNLIGDHASELDLDRGVIRFSGSFTGIIEFPFQVLGTESDNTLTWLWGWAEEQTEIPRDLLRSSLEMRAWGEAENIRECTAPSVDLSDADGSMISLIAVEVCGASCYYRDDYEGGSLFLLVSGQQIDAQPSLNADGLSRQLLQLVSLYDLNHRNALRSYLQLKSLPFIEEGTAITGKLESGEDIMADFDSSGRLVSINGEAVRAA